MIRSALPDGTSVSFVSGNFNILHPGHLRLLKFAAEMADMLVVGVNPDHAAGVVVPGQLRLDGVRALKIVHAAVLLDNDLANFIAELRPDIIVKGKEFEDIHNPEAEIVETYGGKLVFSSGDVNFVSTELLRQELTPSAPLLRSAEGFPERHTIDRRGLGGLLAGMAGLRVAVIGDTIIDDYISCDPLGMSQEDPTIVVSPIETHTFVGGAGIVAAHARNLGAETHFFSVLGADETADFAERALGDLGIRVHGLRDDTRPTTRKQRYRAMNKTLLRVNHLRQHDISKTLAAGLLKDIVALLPRIDLLMFSDFNYGCLPHDLVEAIVDAAHERGIMMTADSQASSQMSDISRFRRMELITPTEREARLAMRDQSSGLAVLAADLREKAAARNVVVTLGEDGMIVLGEAMEKGQIADRIPALNSSPKDVAGAGDTFFTAASMSLRAGANIWSSAYLGSVAAAIQVSRVGNIPLNKNDILFELDQTEFH